MLNEQFVKDLFKLCKKHKVNLNIPRLEQWDGGYLENFEVDITGAWDIRNDCEAVQVYKINDSEQVMSIYGDLKVVDD